MSDDYGKATAAPSVFTVNGVDYRVAKMGPRIYGELQQFLKSHVPDPRIMAKELCAGMPDAVAVEIWRDLSEQARSWPPTFDDPEGRLILTTTHEGAAQLVYSLLRQHAPDMTRERARLIAEDMSSEDIVKMIMLSLPEPDFDPKSRPAPTEDRGPVPA